MPITLKNTDFSTAPDTAAVTANTELYDNWISGGGSGFEIADGKLDQSVVNNQRHWGLYLDPAAVTPVLNQRIAAKIESGDWATFIYVHARWRQSDQVSWCAWQFPGDAGTSTT